MKFPDDAKTFKCPLHPDVEMQITRVGPPERTSDGILHEGHFTGSCGCILSFDTDLSWVLKKD